jgi:hypothetical protein
MFATLKSAKVVAEYFGEGSRIMSIDDFTELGIRRDLLNAEDGAEIVRLNLPLKASLKLKQRRILKEKHGETGHVAIVEPIADFALLPGILDLLDMLPNGVAQSAKTQQLLSMNLSPPE